MERIDEFINKLKTQNANNKTTAKNKKLVLETKKRFEKAMDDDFNTPEALAVIFELIRTTNPFLDKNQISKTQAKEILIFLKKIDKIFNFIFPAQKEKISGKIRELAKKREQLRKQKKWQESDEIRKEIEKLGFEIKDTSRGTTIKKK